MANLHTCHQKGQVHVVLLTKSKGQKNLDDIERMCRERSEGFGSSSRAAIQIRTNEERRWWQYGGSIMLDRLVKYQEQTSVGRIARRRSKEPAKELRRSGAYDRQHGGCQGTIRMEIALQNEQRNAGVINSMWWRTCGKSTDFIQSLEH